MDGPVWRPGADAEAGRQLKWSNGRLNTFNIHRKSSDWTDTSQSPEESLSFIDTGEFCCHKGCGFVYNVQQEKCLERSSFILQSVPLTTYVKLAPVFGLDPNKRLREDDTNRCKVVGLQDDDEEVDNFIHLVETEIGYLSGASDDAQVEVGSRRDHGKDKGFTAAPCNPYLRYLKRISRWRDDKKAEHNLGSHSKEITSLIISEFLQWYKSIGEDDEETMIDESVLQDLFQIGFDSPTANAIALRIKEMPVVPTSLAELQNEPEFSIESGLRKLVKMDIQLESMPAKLMAFGKMLPTERPPLRFKPPNNKTKKTWTECERVPVDLESMKVVWDGIENLRSTVAFSNWLKQHPEVKPPRYLEEKGLLDVDYEEWMQIFKGFEMQIASEGVEVDAKPKNLDEVLSSRVYVSRKSTAVETLADGESILGEKRGSLFRNRSSYDVRWKL